MPCSGDSTQSCGGTEGFWSFYVASMSFINCKKSNINQLNLILKFSTACDTSYSSRYTRFGDHCYDNFIKESILQNADFCEEKGGFLWYPETTAEIAFVRYT